MYLFCELCTSIHLQNSKLNKCVYGLNEAFCFWYKRVCEEFTKIGLTKSDYDDALFYYKPNKKEPGEGIIVIHVDDFLYGGSKQYEKKIEEIHQEFVVGSEFNAPFKYVGLDVNRDDNAIIVDQSSYIKRIEELISKIETRSPNPWKNMSKVNTEQYVGN